MTSRSAGWALAVAALASLAIGCRTVAPPLPLATAQALADRPDAHLRGKVLGLSQQAILDERDNVYALAWDRSSQKVAAIVLDTPSFKLQRFELPPVAPGTSAVVRLAPMSEVALNAYEFDVEAVAFSPDGAQLVTAGRDGAVRLFDASGGKVGAVSLEAPLTAVAFDPSGRFLFVGAVDGTLTTLELPSLRYAGELRPHTAAISALVVRGATLFSGSWDKSVVRFDVSEGPVAPDTATLRYERKGDYALVRGSLGGTVALTFALDARMPHVVVRSDVARGAGIEPGTLPDSVQIPTAMGQAVARVAKGQTLVFKGLSLSGVDVAICDACVPVEAHGVLGAPVMAQIDVAFDESRQSALLRRKVATPTEAAPGSGPESSRQGLVLAERARHPFPWFVNDLSLDARGEGLAVAFSEGPAVRTPEISVRDRRGELAPAAEGDAVGLVRVEDGALIHTWRPHRGVVSTVALSPDGKTVVSGGWDKRVFVLEVGASAPVSEQPMSGIVRRVRFSPDGRLLATGTWTPINPFGDRLTDPSLQLFSVHYDAEVRLSDANEAGAQ